MFILVQNYFSTYYIHGKFYRSASTAKFILHPLVYKRPVFGFSSNGLPIQVVLSNGNGLKSCQASRETLQRVKLLVADSLQKGFHIVVALAIAYFTIWD